MHKFFQENGIAEDNSDYRGGIPSSSEDLERKAADAIYNGKSFPQFFFSLKGEYSGKEAREAYNNAIGNLNHDAKISDGDGYGEEYKGNDMIELNESTIRNIVANILYNCI